MLSRLSRLTRAELVLAALALAVHSAAAQDFRGSITGSVADSSGGVLPGVTVTVTNTETGVSHEAVTDEKGLYKVLYINAGTYAVSAELQGFKKVTYPDNPVRVGEVLRGPRCSCGSSGSTR